MKTLILGIGNDILGDDGVGINIARKLTGLVKSADITVEETAAAGLALLERIRGYQRLIIADAYLTDKTEAGKIHRLTLQDLSKTNNTFTAHEAALATAIELGKALFPGEMPTEVVVYAVQTYDVEHVTGKMTPKVKAAVPQVVRLIMAEIKGS
jgi:hydrogenase maturation protease